MVRITALMVLKCIPTGSDPVILATESDTSSFRFYEKSTVKKLISLAGRHIAKDSSPGRFQHVPHKEYIVYCYNQNGLCAVGFMDEHYPHTSAVLVLQKVLEEYIAIFGESWKTVQADNAQQMPYLREMLIKFQDPAEADMVIKLKRVLDETSKNLDDSLKKIIARGETLESLYQNAAELRKASKMFKKQAEEMNSCCAIL